MPAAQEQSDLRGRPWRGQDGDRRGIGIKDSPWRGPRRPERRGHLFPGYGGASRWHKISRRLRGALEGGFDGAQETKKRGSVYRRDSHAGRRWGDERRLPGRLQYSKTGAGFREAQMDWLVDLP